jgi:hypothetical protein
VKLSSRKELLKQSDIVLQEIRQRLHEDPVNDESLALKIDEFAELSDEIDRVDAQLKELKARYNDLNSVLLPVMQQYKEMGQKALETKKYLITIKRAGYERVNPSYKQAFELSLTKVNQKIKDILNDTLESTKTVTQISASLGVQRISEAGLFSTIMDKLKTLFGALTSKIKSTNSDLDGLKRIAKKLK